ncbi:NAD(P)-dependent oxidoreductase [Martelella mediterranea]|uniref:NAD(P)-dependent oxidoreductase n=1 Tax=Martelella mediterranea TaxID=293089 RepID=UPI001E5CE509|nr:NAD(P)-dependent oxidoreductase [Martelella mediterranea]MCD1634980.1 NAD(P)-dependent oxidoreductase [Martelella mediterranea]
MSVERIGLVGLGNMGKPMARHLIANGFELQVFDLDRALARDFSAEIGATSAESLQELGRASDIVITMLPTGRVVRDVVTGENGLVAGLDSGDVVIDMSSSEPSGSRALARELAKIGIDFVDAPVSGGVPGAVDATLTIMVGAKDQALFDRVRPVLSALGKKIIPTGDVGTGHAMKALNNFIAGSNFAAASEALILGARFGLDRATMLDIINTSTGRNFASEKLLGQQVLTEKYSSGFTLGLLSKDVGIAAALSKELEAGLPTVAQTNAWWQAALEGANGADDHTTAYRYWSECAANGRKS